MTNHFRHRKRVSRVAITLLAIVLVLAAFVAFAPNSGAAVRPTIYKPASTVERHVPVQIIRLAVKTSPLPSEERAIALFESASHYWNAVSGGRYTLLQDGPVLTAYSNNPPLWQETNPRSRRYGESDLPPRPHPDTVQLLVSEYTGLYSRGGGRQVFLNGLADRQDVAHEFGHVFGLGHSSGFDADGLVMDYVNTWSVMGSGRGTPDGAMMQQLGLMEIRNVPTGHARLYVDPMGLSGRDTYTWLSPSGVRYFLDYRSPVGTDRGVSSGRRVLVYSYSGHHTMLYDELRPGREHRIGGKWVRFDRATSYKARIEVHS